MNIWKRLEVATDIRVDMDGTLCFGAAFTPEECLRAEPRLDVIRKINELGFRKNIIIWTARQNNLIEATLEWAVRHGVKYNAIDNKKNPSEIYIDDRAINVEDFIAEEVS